MEGESRALWVEALGDPISARDLHRPHEDRAAPSLTAASEAWMSVTFAYTSQNGGKGMPAGFV